MKRLLLLLFSFTLFAQDYGNNADAVEICAKLQSSSFTNNKAASDALNQIISVVGLSKNFVLYPCDNINNAIAITYKGDRFILYDRKFMNTLSNYTSNWSNLFVLAHEVGHHVNGHTLDLTLYANDVVDSPELSLKRKQELEADKFAAFVLAKMGATYSQTAAAINLLSTSSDDSYSTHPTKNKRIEAIRSGYEQGTTKSPEKNNSSIAAPKYYGDWNINYVPKSNPFDESEKSIYSFGELIPKTNINLSTKPKILIEKSGGHSIISFSNLNLEFSNRYQNNYNSNGFGVPLNKLVKNNKFRNYTENTFVDGTKIELYKFEKLLSISIAFENTKQVYSFRIPIYQINDFVLSEFELKWSNIIYDNYKSYDYNLLKKLLNKIKDSNEMFIKINNLSLVERQWDRNVFVRYPENKDSYIYFSLKGSTKALNFLND